MKRMVFMATTACLLNSAVLVRADQTLVLKNGRQITVQSYREENGIIKFYGYGGEIGIAKEQILTIRDSTAQEAKGLDVPVPARAPLAPPRVGAKVSPPTQPAPAPKPPSLDEEKEKEAKEYQRRLTEISERLKDIQERYGQAIRGTTSTDPTLLTTEEQLKARADDITSRALDAQYNPSGAVGTKLVTPSPFSSLPPTVTDVGPSPAAPRSPVDLPAYTERQKLFSDLRSQTRQIENERNLLIEEMKRKKIEGAEFLQ